MVRGGGLGAGQQGGQLASCCRGWLVALAQGPWGGATAPTFETLRDRADPPRSFWQDVTASLPTATLHRGLHDA